MKVDKLRRLFGAQEHPAHKAQSKNVERETRRASEDDSAVRLAPGLKQRASVQEADASRAERVSQIRSEVRSGDYQVRTEEVAKSLIRDLF
jgi:anti-sigma28 factor (negative regulator of flagellin synthesis)